MTLCQWMTLFMMLWPAPDYCRKLSYCVYLLAVPCYYIDNPILNVRLSRDNMTSKGGEVDSGSQQTLQILMVYTITPHENLLIS